MQVSVEGNSLIFSGVMDESSDFKSIETVIKQVMQKHSKIIFDLSGVDRSNSTGIRGWLKVLTDTNPAGRYVKAPCWLLEQISMLPKLCPASMLVESMILPFYSEETDGHMLKYCEVGREIPISEDYDDFELAVVDDAGHKFELDATSDVFYFISLNLDAYNREFASKKRAS